MPKPLQIASFLVIDPLSEGGALGFVNAGGDRIFNIFFKPSTNAWFITPKKISDKATFSLSIDRERASMTVPKADAGYVQVAVFDEKIGIHPKQNASGWSFWFKDNLLEPENDNEVELGTDAKRLKRVRAVAVDTGDVNFKNKMRMTEDGEDLVLVNKNNEIIKRWKQEGEVIKGKVEQKEDKKIFFKEEKVKEKKHSYKEAQEELNQ